jgi:hypothetical protein
MNVFVGDQNIAKGDAVVFAQGLVVVAGNQNDLFAMSRASQYFLHHGVLQR